MSNLVNNPGFDILGPGGANVFQNWTNSTLPILGTPLGVSINTENSLSPPNAAEITLAGTLSQMITGLIPGNSYTLSVFVNPNGILANIFTATLTSIGILPVNVFATLTIDVSLLTPGVYNLQSINFIVPVGITSATLTFAGVGGLGGGILLDNVVIALAVVCYSGDSLVHTKNIQTGEIKEIEARNVTPENHLVYSTTKNNFISITRNIASGPTKNIRLIKKDALGNNQPSNDLYITPGHCISINGVITKVRNISQAKRTKNRSEIVYSICTEENQPILINNLPVIAWTADEYNKYISKLHTKSDNMYMS